MSYKSKALDITTQIVTASLQNNSLARISTETGKNVAEYFKAIYEGVKEATKNANE
ncbi:MAG: hypothetical protein J1F01_05505 [Oscillospiraceae bacterium]|nr:hypothetical protein [Oscillospiraceae bacterium]